MVEPNILKKLFKYDFIINLISSFQDYDNLYLVTNYYEGDILDNYKDEYMSEKQIKFISACIIQSLIYLRKEEVINRDIRMKNLIMDRKKYLNLIDFSFAIKYSDRNNRQNDIVGSKYESAPEVLNHSIYDYNSEYYRIGTILYYLIFKQYANDVKNHNNISQIAINYKNVKNYSSSCIDFLNKLMISNYKKRIGYKSINELKNHYWFDGFDWKNFEKKKMKSPLKFMKKKFKFKYCKKFVQKKIHINFEKNKIYSKLLYNFDYVNKKIIISIFKAYKKNIIFNIMKKL